MFRLSNLIVAAGLLALWLTPSLASDSGRASFDPSKFVAFEGSGGTLPISTDPGNAPAPAGGTAPEGGIGSTLPISTNGPPPPENGGGSTLPISTDPGNTPAPAGGTAPGATPSSNAVGLTPGAAPN